MLISNLDIAEKWFIIAPCENSHCCWRWMAPLLWTAVWGKNLSSHKRGTSLYLLVRLIKWYGKPLYWAALLPVNRLLCSGLNSPPFQTVRRLKTGESSALNANAHWLTPLHVERDCQVSWRFKENNNYLFLSGGPWRDSGNAYKLAKPVETTWYSCSENRNVRFLSETLQREVSKLTLADVQLVTKRTS